MTQIRSGTVCRLVFAGMIAGSLLTASLLVERPATAADFSAKSLDFFQGPLVNDGRVVGLGGAYVSIAEGVAGHVANPAAFAVRPASFTNAWFDWDVGVSQLAAVGGDNDLDMSGNDGKGDSALATQVGLNAKFGRFGIGIHGVTQNHKLAVGEPGVEGVVGVAQRRWEVDQSYSGFGLGWAFRDGAWVVGVVIGTAQATITSPDTTAQIVKFSTALHPSTFGLLWAPRRQRYRVGMSLRLPQRMLQASATRVAKLGVLTIPESVQMPGQLALGASWMFGDRQTNIRPTYGDRELKPCCVKAGDLRRRYALVSADVIVITSVHNGIGVRSYLDNKVQASGESAMVAVRVGAESEVLPNRLQIRTGSYFEPSRFANTVGRMHWTIGGDVRVTAWWDWRINLVADFAPAYQNFALGFGLWR